MAKEAYGSANESVVVEDVAADGGVLGRAQRTDLALLGRGGNRPDGPAAHASGPEFEVAVKAVVELAPSLLGHEFFEAGACPAGQAGGKPGLHVI